MNVKQALRSYVGIVQIGESDGLPLSGPDLAADLSAASVEHQFYFHLCFAALAVVFAGSCVMAVKFLNDVVRLELLFAVTGVTLAALIAQMVSLWKQKITADVVALLARNLQPGDVRAVVEVLFAKL
jgi:hypothetical protein